MKKVLKNLIMFLFVFVMMCSTLTVNAASKDDYKALKYANVENVGKNQISITGKGIFAVKVGGSVNDANAAIFKDAINPRNFKATLRFDKDYGNGEGYNAGWYSVNFSRTPNWFSSVKSVIAQNDVYGVNITLKLDPMDKKKVYIQPSRYSPGSGFVYLLDATPIDIKKDWQCTLEIKKSKLYLDGTFIVDLDDAFSLAIPDDEAFVGFGGFSESFYNVGMTVTYDGKATRNDYDNYGKEQQKPSTQDKDKDKDTSKDTDKDTDKEATKDKETTKDKDKKPNKKPEVNDEDKTTSDGTENTPVQQDEDSTVNNEDTSKDDLTTQPETDEMDDEYIYVDITGFVVAGIAVAAVIIGLLIYLIVKLKRKS